MPDIQVNTIAAGVVRNGDILARPDGGYIAFWSQRAASGGDWDVYSQRYDVSGNAVGGQTLVNALVGGDQTMPMVTALNNGGYAVMFASPGAAHPGITEFYVRLYDAAGQAEGPEVRVTDTSVSSGSISSHQSEGFVVAWDDDDGQQFVRTFDTAGAPLGSAVQVSAYTGLGPTATVFDNGSGYVTLEVATRSGGAPGNHSDIVATRYLDDGTMLGETVVNPLLALVEGSPTVTGIALANGDFVVAWVSADYGVPYVYKRVFNASGVSKSAEHSIGSDPSPQSDPHLLALADGGYMLAWTRTTATGSDLLAQRIGVLGEPTGQLLYLAEDAGNHTDLRLDELSDGSIVASWRTEDEQIHQTRLYYVTGGNSLDTLSAPGRGVMFGGQFEDLLISGPGDDVLDGGNQVDTVSYANATSGVTVRLWNERQDTGGGGVDTLANLESAIGSAFNDVLIGNSSSNVLEGRDGDDLLDGGESAPFPGDVLDGGAGFDTVTYASSPYRVTVSLSLSGAQQTFGSGIDTLIGVEGLIGTNFNDVLEGDSGDNLLVGGLGVDTLSYERSTAGVTVSLALTTPQNTVGAGTDEIREFENLKGSGADDILIGDDGANLIEGGSGADVLYGGGGNDTLIAGGDGNTVYGGLGDDDIQGGNFRNTVSYADLTGGLGVTVNLSVFTAQYTIGGGTDKISGFQNLVGTAFNDTLTGDGYSNIIEGGAGFDTINGGGGNGIDIASYASASAGVTVSLAVAGLQDTGGAGVDVLTAMEGLQGSAFNDLLIASALNNVIAGGDGIDTLSYRALSAGVTATLAGQKASLMAGGSFLPSDMSGIENLIGTGLRDTLTGNSGDNVIDPGGNSQAAMIEILDGGAGIDTLTFDYVSAGVEINLVWTIQQDAKGAGLLTLSNFENVRGSIYDDILRGDDKDNVLSGGDGNDILRGLGGDDTLDGGGGADEANYALAAVALTVNLSIIGPQNTGVGLDTLISIENIFAGIGNDTLTGNAGDNVIYAGLGNDLIEGGLGDDTLDGSDGVDTALFTSAAAGVTVSLATSGRQNTGAAGNDLLMAIENLTGSAFGDSLTGDGGANVLNGGAGDDVLTGGTGNDTLIGGDGDDQLSGDAGDDVLDGGAGFNTVTYVSAAAGVTVNLTAGTASGGAGADTLAHIDKVIGSVFADTLTSANQGNVLQGLFGDDVFHFGGVAADAAQLHTFDGGAGTDLVSFAEATAAVTASLASSTVHAMSRSGYQHGANIIGIEGFVGSGYGDTLTGDAGANVLNGEDGNDTLSGEGGDDILEGGAADDVLNGGAGADTLRGDAGSDVLFGLDGNDVLFGGGGTGNAPDYFYGGAGNDTYYVSSTLTSPLDLVFEGTLFAGSEAGVGDVDTIHSTGQFFWDYYSVAETLHIDNAIDGGAHLIGGKDVANKAIFGSSGTDFISSYGGSARVDAGAGTDAISFSLYGLAESYRGSNTVVMKAGSGTDYVFDFRSGTDRIDLSAFNFGITGAQVLAQAINVDNAGTENDYCFFYLTNAGGVDNMVVLMGMLSNQLQASDFIT